MKYLALIFVIFVFGCQEVERPKLTNLRMVPQRDYLCTFDWSAYYFYNGQERVNPKFLDIEFDGNFLKRKSDSCLWIMPLETNEISISFGNGNHLEKVKLIPEQNQHIDSSWYKLSFGELPTPLNNESFKAWNNFAKYRMLNQPIPRFAFEDKLANSTITSEDLKGKITFLNFWYYGCAPCMAEMPALKSLAKEFENEGDVQFISVSLDSIFIENGKTMALPSRMGTLTGEVPAHEMDIGFHILPSAEPLAEKFNVVAFPTNMIIDRDGVIRYLVIGAQEGDNSKMKTLFAKKITEVQAKK